MTGIPRTDINILLSPPLAKKKEFTVTVFFLRPYPRSRKKRLFLERLVSVLRKGEIVRELIKEFPQYENAIWLLQQIVFGQPVDSSSVSDVCARKDLTPKPTLAVSFRILHL